MRNVKRTERAFLCPAGVKCFIYDANAPPSSAPSFVWSFIHDAFLVQGHTCVHISTWFGPGGTIHVSWGGL